MWLSILDLSRLPAAVQIHPNDVAGRLPPSAKLTIVGDGVLKRPERTDGLSTGR
jgi:hypothetical protein